jgi:ketosteroid isomerase-like protein
MSEAAAIHGLLDAYFAGLNGEDWQGLEALLCEDAVLEAPGASRRGASAVARYFREALAPYPEHVDAPGRRIVDGRTAAVEIHFAGRMANAAPVVFDAVDIFDVRGGRIARLTSWYDSHAVRRELLAGRARAAGEGAAAPALALAASALGWRSVHALGGRWEGEVPAALCLPARLIDAGGELDAEDLRGRAVLIRGNVSLEADLLAAAAAVACDGASPPSGASLRGRDFALAGLPPGEGLLVSAPDADHLAHAVLLR